MDLEAVEKQKEEILDWLKGDNERTLVLVGVAGVGKTWMARKIRDSAISQSICFVVLWVSMNIKHDTMSLFKSLAHQLSLPSTIEEMEEDDIDGDKEETLDTLKKRISKKIEERRSVKHHENKPLLLILDGEEPMSDGPKALIELKALLKKNRRIKLKILISRRNSDVGEIAEDPWREMKIEPLSGDDALSLLKKRVATRVSNSSGFGEFSESIARKSLCIPAATLLMAVALNQIGQHDSDVWTLDDALEEAADSEEAVKDATPLLHHAYEMLPGGIITDCFWHCREFFHNFGGVHYNELITYWIMEGYFCPIKDVEKAYEKGHSVLIELLNRRMIKIQEDNIVILEGATQTIVDNRRGGFSGTASLGFPSMVPDGRWKGLGRITPMNGMIKTLCSSKKWEKVHTLLIDGSRLLREVPEKLFHRLEQLEVLALFDLKLKPLPLSLSQLENLLVLVLRGCDLLDNIDHISELKMLTALEISGASSLEKIPDDFFAQMTQLQSLNLSGSQLKELPSTLSRLTELRWLILRRCCRLENLPKIPELTKLEVLDLSDSTFFNNVQEKSFAIFKELQFLDLSSTQIVRLPFVSELPKLTRLLLRGCTSLSRLPKLEKLPRLQILDLSYADKLKEINALKFLDQSGSEINHSGSITGDLSELYLSSCSNLEELPSTEKLTGLKLLDLSDACSLTKFVDKSFNHLSLLHSIDLSNTKITELPTISNLHNLRFLLLRGCSSLKSLDVKGLVGLKKLDLSGCVLLVELQESSALQKLEFLDLSGCTALPKVEEQTFVNMSHLQKLNLSATKIESLSALNSNSLCHLALNDCEVLKILPPSRSLSKLEVLDLCGAKVLGEIQSSFFEQMAHLQDLDLSHTRLQEFSILSKLTNLRRLSLKGCPDLKTAPFLEELAALEFLDLSETDVGSLPSLDKLSNLRKLLLRQCSSLEILPPLKSLILLEILDISGTRIEVFPYDICNLAHLKFLDMGDSKVNVDWERIDRLPQELIWGQFGISNLIEIPKDGKKPSILVNGTKIFQILEEHNSNFLETCLSRNFFCVCTPKEEADDVDMYHERYGIVSNDAYFYIKEFPHGTAVQSIELCGFKSFPTGVEKVLGKAEYISLVGNGFMRGLSSVGSNTLNLKGCWLERCTEMVNIFSDPEDVKLGENLQIIWVSNLINLESLCSEKLGSVNFVNLQHLHLDCCPMLEDVFSSTSGLENLKFIKIKFCERLKTVFKCNSSVNCRLTKLQELHLFELPELTSFGAEYPREVKPNVSACPNFKDLDGVLNGQNASAQIVST